MFLYTNYGSYAPIILFSLNVNRYLITTLTSSSLFTLGIAHASMALPSLNHNLDFVELVHADFVFLLLARQNKSKLSFCSCFVRRFGIAHASMALPSLNHHLFAIHNVDTLRGVGHTAALQVVDDIGIFNFQF